MGPTLLLTAGLFLGQIQEVQVIGPEQQTQPQSGTTSGGWFSKVRTWSWQDRSVINKIQDRIGGIFGRTQNKEMKIEGGAGPQFPQTGSPSSPGRIIQRVTTEEPPLLDPPPTAPKVTPVQGPTSR